LKALRGGQGDATPSIRPNSWFITNIHIDTPASIGLLKLFLLMMANGRVGADSTQARGIDRNLMKGMMNNRSNQ
jgi:hypothetical protein